ncbi:uncharacterized protein YqgC (DUF456 family) [Bacillus tianshenii]|uniref:Uncharacterized protein YqgC (DUF456 family) n=1 Tax=Sutcliffiella tianshenii TaxID=1463404 RepID=A0ABS2P070_9BACI|nr:DUF456 domain-containing protein [Bacillus tianshenii]MBM7620271.1 uncharacterized protein YqgC (DUF456 family) [Bacillus tianshenii]
MEIVYWIIIIALFVVSFVGLIYPIIPSVLFIVGGFLLYGVFFSFEELTVWFWIITSLFVVLLFVADYFANLLGVKKFGGSKASIWGSTIGLLAGPFVIPVAGIILGPFLGAILGELLFNKKEWKSAVKIGFGSVVGLFSSVLAKGLIQMVMILCFLFFI